jgi:fumarate reductase iron-sulfur subunit
MSQPPLEIEIFRYRPDVEEEGTWERYSVPCHPDDSLLDVLHHIKEEIDPSLSYRWSCRMGVCGSCAMSVDGTPRLACATRAAALAKPARVAPLANFPVLRDLAVELDDFLERLRAVRPWLIAPDAPAAGDGASLQSPAELAAYAGLAACIHCGLCDAACPALSHQPDFLGPAALAAAARYASDARDQGERERHALLVGRRGVWSCTQSQVCSTVCPQGVDPAGALQRSQLTAALRAVGLRRERS